MKEYDYLILGHGIAGATLAWELRRRHRRVLVLDAPNPNSASNVAAGLMNPVAGKRFALAWRADELLSAASRLYGEMGAHFGEQFFVELPIWKLFSSVAEQNTMLARSADHPWQDFVVDAGAALPALPGLHDEFGGLCIRRGGYVRLRELLAALTAESLADGTLQHETFDWQQLVIGAAEVTYAGRVRARHFICCEGAAATQNPFFSWLPLTPNQGEVLDVDCPGLSQAQVLNKGAYVVPLGAGQFRVGATYRWPPFPEGTTPEARAELSQRLAATTSLPFGVCGQRAGVRPAVRDRKPLLGRHPETPEVSIFNGFGSKGVMLAPRLAVLLAEHLEHPEAELWPEVNIRRYQALYKAAPSAVGFSS